MTINEMLKKVEAYNEMSEIIGARFHSTVQLCMLDTSFPCTESYFAEDSKSFKKTIKETYIDETAQQILSYKDYAFNTPVTFTHTDFTGSEWKTTIEFTACEM